MHEISVNQDYVQDTPDHSGTGMGIRGFRGDYGGAGNQHLRPETSVMVNVGELTTLELIELLHEVADEIQLRMMQTADDGK